VDGVISRVRSEESGTTPVDEGEGGLPGDSLGEEKIEEE